MWTDFSSLTSFRTAASEVVLPLPVAPVMKMIPFFSSAIFKNGEGRFMSCTVGILLSSFRKTME